MFMDCSSYVVCGIDADAMTPAGPEQAGRATGACAEHMPPSHSLPVLGVSGAGHLQMWARTLAGVHGQATGKGL